MEEAPISSFVNVMADRKKETSKLRKKEYKKIIKQIKKKIDKKIRRNEAKINGNLIVDPTTSLSTLLKLEKDGFSVELILIPLMTREDHYATAPRNISGVSWLVSW
jgi:hypothetical protein